MKDLKIDYRLQSRKYGQVMITKVSIPDEIKNKSVTVGNTEIEFFDNKILLLWDTDYFRKSKSCLYVRQGEVVKLNFLRDFFEDITRAKELLLSEKEPGNFQANL